MNEQAMAGDGRLRIRVALESVGALLFRCGSVVIFVEI